MHMVTRVAMIAHIAGAWHPVHVKVENAAGQHGRFGASKVCHMARVSYLLGEADVFSRPPRLSYLSMCFSFSIRDLMHGSDHFTQVAIMSPHTQEGLMFMKQLHALFYCHIWTPYMY